MADVLVTEWLLREPYDGKKVKGGQTENREICERDKESRGVHLSLWLTGIGPIRWSFDHAWAQSIPAVRLALFVMASTCADQLFHVAYVVLKFANAPRPGVWVLERSTDFGQTYKPWQYFADTPSDCYNVFGVTPMDRPTHDDSVTCTTEYSNIVPLENGEIHLSLVNGRPSSKNFTHSSMLHEWTKATNVRLRFLRTKTLLGHLMAVTQQDPTVTRRYFYSLKDISIGGRCVCNGHADECDGTGSADPNRLVCKCQHNTCGESCEQCCPGFVQKPWQPATPNNLFECEACNCLGHSSECYYDPEVAQNRLSLDMRGDFNGGGVCTNCQHNTEGINCERCKPGFFRVPDTPLTSPYVCQSCQCNSFFTTGTCEQLTGRCYCLPGYAGDDCNQCASGYVGFPNCKADLIKKTKSRTNLEPEVYIPLTSEIVDIPPPPPYSQPEVVQPTPGYDGGYIPDDFQEHGEAGENTVDNVCECHMNGTAGFTCSVEGDGQCPCKYNYAGRYCEGCALGYYNFPECLPCNCDEAGSLSHRCDIQQGQCECRSGFMGRTCDRCATGYYNYPRCTSCDCNVMGSTQEVCDRDTGTCLCQEPFTGQRCDQCKSGSYSFPNCIRCNCYGAGVLDDDSKACTDSGQCTCKPAYAGMSCEKCAPGYYGYPDCKSCSCESGGSIGSDCDPRSGQCRCKEHVEGRNCDKCQVGFFNFPNCLECNCNPAGRAPNTECPSVQTMTCDCKSLVEGPDCDQCKPLYWNLLKDNPEGCEECGCFRPGTSSGLGTCDMAIGQCACKANVQGRICMDCRDGSFGMSEVDSLGCQGCSCDVGGAVTDVCDKATGQCVCREGMEGRQCDIPTQGQYVPGLYQYKYEAEDADTPRGMPVRFGYSEKDFPGFSWRGYAIMNTVQPRIILSVLVDRPALYRVVLSYVNPGQETVIGNIRANPLSQSADVVSQQSSEIVFNPTTDPMTVTVVGNSFIMPFVLNPGQWSFTIEVSRVLLDYMVLLPAAYFEAPLLQLKVEVPCKYEIPEDPKDHCLMYTHLPLEDFTTVQAESGFFRPQQDDDDMNNTLSVLGDKIATQYIQPSKFYPLMALLDHNQMVLLLELTLPKAGEYVFVIEYANFETRAQTLQIRVDKTEGKNQGIFNINTCNFSFRCRAVGIDDNGREARFKVTSRSTTISLSGDKLRVAIDSLTAIPVKSWDPDYIIPKPLCVASYGPFSNHKCVQSMYTEPVGTVRILPSSGQDSMRRQPLLVLANSKLFLLDREQNQLEFSGRLLSAGRTVFLLHYFQPESTGYTAQVKVTTPLRQEIQGVIQVDYCPHSAGCRATMLFAGLGEQVDITQPDIRIMITIPADRTIWVDHVVAIPEFSYTPSLLMDSRIDKSGDFIKQCGKFDFNLNERDLTPFCRKSIMSLSAHYNDGANPCNCNPQGSSSQTCSPLGGQCPCKDNIVGRSCDVCATGYFGFPSCRECPCGENRLCDPVTGECICPPRSRQPECTVCEEGTYGYHPLLGCEESVLTPTPCCKHVWNKTPRLHLSLSELFNASLVTNWRGGSAGKRPTHASSKLRPRDRTLKHPESDTQRGGQTPSFDRRKSHPSLSPHSTRNHFRRRHTQGGDRRGSKTQPGGLSTVIPAGGESTFSGHIRGQFRAGWRPNQESSPHRTDWANLRLGRQLAPGPQPNCTKTRRVPASPKPRIRAALPRRGQFRAGWRPNQESSPHRTDWANLRLGRQLAPGPQPNCTKTRRVPASPRRTHVLLSVSSFVLCSDIMATATRAPRQWCLTKTETINPFENWRSNLVYVRSLDTTESVLTPTPCCKHVWNKTPRLHLSLSELFNASLPCDCDAMGILDLNYPSCNRNTGQCSCKPNVGGRRCDRCLPGYYNFPYCSPCSCSADGVTEDVCDQRTGRCLCKTNVNGPRCDQCKANTYHLSTRNPEGCHSCFCFGATPYCRSSDLHYTELLDMEDWTVSNQVGSEVMRFNDKVEVKLGDLIQPDEPVYWVAPGIYLGNLVTSYGGSLTYTVEYQVTKTALMARMRPTRLPDVLLSGNDMTIMYSHPVIPEPDEPLTVTVDLLEGNFVHSNSKGAVSREDLLMVLADLQALLIRASYREKILSATIESVKLSITTQTFSGKPALDVEYCNCPYGYKGTSCQECDEGYYRSKTGPYLGQCVKCECYGHASSCDENGACIDCEHHTMGDRCDKCMTGYYGEPRRGTPDDCQICACPMATEDNNFASECQPLAGGQFQCTCLPGYDGPNCDRCAIGFYGKPSEVGGFCQRCDCSGNVRLTKVGMKNVEQCDAETGQCLDCLDNTGGRNCQKCAAGFYGDAMKARSCTKCRNCDVCGTVPDVCDDKTGKCLCRDHVVGDKCDQCEENHYGFDSCQGCQACDCSAEGSLEKSCHPKTGQCTCKPGVTGRRCDRCEPKHSNFTSSGCRACNCPKDGPCDPQTGECRCPEGLTGTDCESCKNETLLYTPRGCW
ncbi:laminin subunit, partial [Branchiostoma belcheri]